jgi:quercetin dioxygenase-like cupin family protein
MLDSMLKLALLSLTGFSIYAAVVNPATAKWSHQERDPPGAESVVLHEDPQSGALELFARYPAGHIFPPHWHDSNERIVLIEGRLSLREDDGEKFLEPGGFALLAAGKVQRMACVSKSRCSFYVYWDGNPKSHSAQ